MIVEFDPYDSEVTKFRRKVLAEVDTGQVREWFTDKEFYKTDIDSIWLYYHEGESVAFVGGTHFNDKLYRTTQRYYILEEARRKNVNTVHFMPNGFMDAQIKRAKELNCDGAFLSIHCFDDRHIRLFDYMKNDVVGVRMMKNEDRQYTAKDFQFLDKEYRIKSVDQKIIFHPLKDGATFEECYLG